MVADGGIENGYGSGGIGMDKKKEKKRKDAVASVDPENANGEDTMEVDAVGKLSYLRSCSQDSPARS